MTAASRDGGGKATASGLTRALDRGLQILDTIAETPPMTLAEISAACDLSPATASRILRTLESRGFVIRDPQTKVYGIGLKAFEVGSRFLSETRLLETCKFIPRRLSAATGQSTTLAILDRSDVVYVDAQDGSSPLRSTPRVGARAPAHATASGKCLLAFRWADGLIQAIGPGPFARMTERTILSLDDLRQDLVTIRQTGLAFENEELHADISCVACAVHDRTGEVIAALAIQSSTTRMTSNMETWVTLLRDAASEASLRLGWRNGIQAKFAQSASFLTD